MKCICHIQVTETKMRLLPRKQWRNDKNYETFTWLAWMKKVCPCTVGNIWTISIWNHLNWHNAVIKLMKLCDRSDRFWDIAKTIFNSNVAENIKESYNSTDWHVVWWRFTTFIKKSKKQFFFFHFLIHDLCIVDDPQGLLRYYHLQSYITILMFSEQPPSFTGTDPTHSV